MNRETYDEPFPDPRGESRRLLLVSYHFPPDQSVGALRWRKLARLLEERGWVLDVITNAHAAGSVLPPEDAADLPSGTRVWQVRSPEAQFHYPEQLAARLKSRLKRRRSTARGQPPRDPGTPRTRSDASWDLASWRGYLRLYFTAREALKTWFWARRIMKTARRVVQPGSHAAIISSGPPHAWHTAGRYIATRTGIPFVMDLRDPWSTRNVLSSYFATPAWLKWSRAQEARAIAAAGLVLTNTDNLREEMANAFPEAEDRLLTVMNGYDEDPLPPTAYPARFTISYLGAIYSGRDPRPLFGGVAAAARDLGLTPQDLEIQLVGNVETYRRIPVRDLVAAEGVDDFVHLRPRVSRAEAMQIMARSHILVSLPWEDRVSVPAKLFEYMRFHAWILAFGYPDSAVERLFRGKDADLLLPDDVAGVRDAVKRRYLQFQQGERPRPLSDDTRYSRRFQAERLATALTRLVMAPAPAGSSRSRHR
jgi:hypothetical protein